MIDNHYKVAMYVRLSREDEDKKLPQSESIENQKLFLLNYAKEHNLNIAGVYQDDGYTGTNFDRPGFIALLNDIEQKKVNMVITKDLSRLGRDYITTGEYLERYFPQRGIRFVAVNDNMDSNQDDNALTPFRLVINDFYARDISQKVRTTMDIKRNQGKFIGSFAPYGYKKDLEDRNKLIVDEDTSVVVQRIYEMYLDNTGLVKIAEILNTEDILCPSADKRSKNPKYNNVQCKYYCWTPEVIRSILTNPTYTGDLTQNKYKKVNYKVKKLKSIAAADWIRVNGTHEPIVSKESFDAVQELMKSKSILEHKKNKCDHILAGLIYCGDCGSRMTYTKSLSGISYCICSSNKRFKACSRHAIKEDLLIDSVLFDLKGIMDEHLNINQLQSTNEARKKQHRLVKQASVEKEVKRIQKRLSEIHLYFKRLLEDKYAGKITEEMYDAFSKDYILEQNRLVNEIARFSEVASYQENGVDAVGKKIQELLSLEKPDKVMLNALIDRIDIFEGNKIKIYYKFKTPNP